MNWVLIGVVLVLLGSAYMGWKKGVVKIMLSLVALIATLLITMVLTGPVGNIVKDNTKAYDSLYTKVAEAVGKKEDVTSAVDELDQYNGQTDIDEAQLQSEVNRVIDKFEFPDALKGHLKSVDIEGFIDNGVTGVQDAIVTYLATQITNIIYNAIVFVCVFIIVYVVLAIIIKLVDFVSMLPVIKQINKGVGLIIGLIKGLLYVWLFFIIMSLICNTEFAATVFAYINDNKILTFLYDNNLIMKLLFMI